MRATDADLAQFEGLIRQTAAMLDPLIEEDFDDIQQLLRVKIWKAVEKFDPARSKLPLKRYVFGCMMNYTKDLKKQDVRRKERQRGSLLFIEDFVGPERRDQRDQFDAQYLAVVADVVYLHVEDEDPLLPNTLTDQERRLIALLCQDEDSSQAKLGRELGVGTKKVQALLKSIRLKMADWNPSEAPAPVMERQAA